MSTKKEKLEKLKELSDEDIDKIYNKYVLPKKPKKVAPKSIKIIDTTTPKYKTLLKLVNKLLVKMKKPKISTLTEFVNIKRQDIINIDKKVIKGMEKEIIKTLGMSHTPAVCAT